MADIQGYITYPNINQIFSANYTAAQGIAPGIVHIQMAPQDTMPDDVGDFQFIYGDQVLTISNCKLDAASFSFDESGQNWDVSFWDRRWRWKFASRGLSGRYNIRNDAGDILEASDKSPMELAQLCLDCMGELVFHNVNLALQLGVLLQFDSARPTVEWNYTNPAEALENLAEYFGCRVILNQDDMVQIVLSGVGADLPETLDLDNASFTPDPLEAPDELVGVVNRQFQYDFMLTPVGKEISGQIVRIKNLSYCPNKADTVTGGWDVDDYPFYNGAEDPDHPGNDTQNRLAMEWVLRAYQIDLFQLGGANLSADDQERIEATIDDIARTSGMDLPGSPSQYILNRITLLNQRLDTISQQTLLPNGSLGTEIRNLPPLIYGMYFSEERLDAGLDGNSVSDADFAPIENVFSNEFPLGNQEEQSIYRKGFYIDLERGIVFFDEPVYKMATQSNEVYSPRLSSGDIGDILVPAKLVLRIAYEVKDLTHQYLRTEITNSLTPPQAPNATPAILTQAPIREFQVYADLVHTIKNFPKPDFTSMDQGNVETNFDEIEDEVNRRLEAIANKYEEVPNPQIGSYVGLKLIALDGAIQQITFSIDDKGTSTTVYRNNDLHPYLMSYIERRYLQRTKGLLSAAQRTRLQDLFRFAADDRPQGGGNVRPAP